MEGSLKSVGEEKPSKAREDFSREKHIKFFKRSLDILPSGYASLDTSRVTVAFFALSGLDVIGALDIIDSDKENIINWIYSNQVLPKKNGSNKSKCGFRGSGNTGANLIEPDSVNEYECAHIAMTYTALASLLILGDDLKRVNKPAFIEGLKAVQLPDGSFSPTCGGSENDMRFIYCACCISYILQDWSGINQEKVVQYIKSSQSGDCNHENVTSQDGSVQKRETVKAFDWRKSYDYGIGQGPNLESHGGSTFCAIASLVLMNRLESSFTKLELERLKRWCMYRQKGGFQGRPNKPVDTCYSFWVGASLQLLDSFELTDPLANREYLIETQSAVTGGFSKWPGNHPDVLHSYFGVCGFSLLNEPSVMPIHSALNISKRAADHLHQLHGTMTTS